MAKKRRKLPVSNKRKLHMKEEYLNKDACIKRAQKLVSYNGWTNVSVEQIAKEIYGHAYVYYHMAWLDKLPVANSMIYKHVADGIDVEDKLDPFQFVWEWMWKCK